MRITFLSPPLHLGGGQRVISIYADRLARRGHDVIVAAPSNVRPSLRTCVRELRGLGRLPTLSRYIRQPPHYFAGIRAQIFRPGRHRPIRFADVPKTEVVIATWWETAEWAHENFPADMPKFHFIQGNEPTFPHLPRERVAATWRLPSRKITISQSLKELIRLESPGPDRVLLIPNSVDTDQFHAPPRGKQTIPTVGMLYSSFPLKGCDVSLRALEICRQTFPNVRLVAFGAEPPEIPLPPGTRFVKLPPQDSIRELYAQCDVWVCGSYSEGFHLPPGEAMACRCPVVSTKVGGPLDIIRDGVNGYLVDTGDHEALGRRLVDVLSLDEAGWLEMSNAALATVTNYTWDDATDLLEAALLESVEKRPRLSSADR